MATIYYSVTGGTPPITVSIQPGGIFNTHLSTPDTGYFTNLPDGEDYTIFFFDDDTPPCTVTRYVNLSSDTLRDSNDLFKYDSDYIAVNLPAKTIIGNLIFLYAATTANTDFSDPDGDWTLLKKVVDSEEYNSWAVWYKIAEESDLGSSVSITFDDAASIYLATSSFSCRTSGPYISEITDDNYDKQENTSLLSPSISTALEGATLVSFENLYDSSTDNQGGAINDPDWDIAEGNNLGNYWIVYNKYKQQSSDGTSDSYDIQRTVPMDMQAFMVQILPDSYVPEEETINLGYLYNGYAIQDARGLASAGWKVPSVADFTTLQTYLGGNAVAGGALKETGLTYWDSPNAGATNSSSFNGRGCGYRQNDGIFTLIGRNHFMWASDYSGGSGRSFYSEYVSSFSYNNIVTSPKFGNSVRLVKVSTTLSDGETGTYVGNDNKVYRTICIGTQEWMADNLAETKFRTLEAIPEVTDGGSWAALETAGLCAYDNNASNV